MAAGIAADLLVHVGADVKDAISGLNRVDSSVNKAGSGFGKASALMGGASLAIVGGLGMAINSAADYEQAISNITALGGEYKASQEAISALALDIGQKTAFSATEGALAIAELAKAGVPVKDILAGAAMEAANLAAAGGISVPEAAVAMANSMNMFGISGDRAVEVADSFAAAANASAADVGQLTQALNQGGPASAALGNSLQETNAVLALFANYGIKGSDAGTSLKTMLQSLTNPSAEAAQRMSELGIAAFDANGNFVGFEALAGQLQSSLKGLTQEQRAAALATIFGSDASRVANILYEEGADGVKQMTDAVSEQGVAGQMAQAKMDNLNGAIEQLKGSFETALIIIGSQFIPVMRKVADGITGALNKFLKLPKPVQKAGGIIAAAVAGFLALASAIGLIITFSGPLIAGIAALTSPILLLVGAVAGLVIAWQTNFLGIRDITTDAFNSIMDVVKPFISFLGKIIDGSDITKKTLEGIPEPLQNIAKVLGLVVRGFTDFYNALSGGKGIKAALEELWEVIGSDKMLGALSALGSQLLTAFSNIDWAALGATLWAGIQSAVTFVGDITEPILAKLGDLTAAIGGWLWEKASAVDWAGILSRAASQAGNIASVIIEKIGDLGQSLKTWYDNAIDSVDWGNLGFIVGEKVGNLAQVLGPKALELITGFATWLTENWSTIGKTLLGLILGLPATIGYIGLTLLPKAAEFVAGFVQGLGINWGTVGNWLKENIWKIPLLIPYLAYLLAPKAWELLKGLITGLDDAWASVKDWLTGVGPLALEAVGNLAETLSVRGFQLLSGLWRGVISLWDTELKPWLSGIPDKAIAAIGGVAETLLAKGNSLMGGMKTGIINTWQNVIEADWLTQLGAKAIAAVGNLAQTLWNAGYNLLWGFGQGIESAASAVYNKAKEWVEKIVGLFTDVPGFSPIRHVGLYGGSELGLGFADGLASMMPKAETVARSFMEAAISNLNGSVTTGYNSGRAGLSMANQGQTIVQNFDVTVNLQELEELAEAGRFVSQLNGTRTLYKAATAGGNI